MTLSDEDRQRYLDMYEVHSQAVESPPPVDWLAEWRLLGSWVEGISYQDPEYLTVLALIGDAERAFKYHDIVTFRQVRDELFDMRAQRWEPELQQVTAWMQAQGLCLAT